MFRIEIETYQAIETTFARTFPDRMLRFLREHLPEQSEANAEERITAATLRAGAWGCTTEHDVATFVVLTFIHGPAFDNERWAADTLRRADVDPSTRIGDVYLAAVRRAIVAGTPLEKREAGE